MSFQIPSTANIQPGEEDQFTSLSEFHDYEPGLEFDDAEIAQSKMDELLDAAEVATDLFDCTNMEPGAVAEDFEDNFEEMLGQPDMITYNAISHSSTSDEDFTYFTNTRMIEVVGDDSSGRRMIIMYAHRSPPIKEINTDKLLRFIIRTLDAYVEQDYTIIYFHYGLSRKSRPTYAWLWNAYKMFDRKYKKNLKALYVVHPTTMIKFIWQIMTPFISVKFGDKIKYVNYIHELAQYLDLDQLIIPDEILKYNASLLASNPRAADIADSVSKQKQSSGTPDRFPNLQPPVTQQYGVTLEFIIENNPLIVHSDIPPIVRQCVEFLENPEALDTEGLFRRSANTSVIRELELACNRGEEVCFRDDPHNAAVMMKNFLRSLEEPLLTFALYEDVIQFPESPVAQKPKLMKVMILEKLPLPNYRLLKYIMQFLWKVQDRSCLNKMTVRNLGVVFGPNLIWAPDMKVNLQNITKINFFAEFLIENQESIFLI